MKNKTSLLSNFLSNLVFLTILATLVYMFFPENACNKSMTFTVSGIDPRFGLEQEEATAFAKAAANVWNQGLGKEVFQYKPDGEIKITFVYDERQRKTIQNNILKEKAKEKTNELSERKESIQIQRDNFEEQKQKFENDVRNFNSDLLSYNKKINEINSHGGAIPEEIQELESEKKSLQNRMTNLEQRQNNLNSYLKSINQNVETYNEGINSVNSVIEIINKNSQREFEQGYYQNKNIVLYEYEDYKSLQRLMAHELGHALGIEHTENPNSLMYYINQGENLSLTQEDIDAYKKICSLK